MAMAGRASADLVHEYVPPSTDPILVERDVTMDCKKMLRSVCLSAERWPASSRQRFGSVKWILCRLGSSCAVVGASPKEGFSPTGVKPRQRRRNSCCRSLRQMVIVKTLWHRRVKT
jgi:hypothetical protein